MKEIVEVELQDLETVLFATAAIKQIENALAARKHDPFVPPERPYTEAHNKLVGIMNAAKRAKADTKINWDAELETYELTKLKQIQDHFNKTSEYTKVDAQTRLDDRIYDNLASKGCVILGQAVFGAVWAGDDRASVKPVPVFLVKITDRGIRKLDAWLNSSSSQG